MLCAFHKSLVFIHLERYFMIFNVLCERNFSLFSKAATSSGEYGEGQVI